MPEARKLRSVPPGALRTRLGLLDLASELDTLTPTARLGLIERRSSADALTRYLAYALPEREAVWWACMCVLHAARPETTAARVIEAARDWVRRPDSEARTAILPLVREAGANSPPGYVGRAVFTSRLADPASLRAGLSVHQAVSGAVALLAPTAHENARHRFHASALDIANGGAGWIDLPGADTPVSAEKAAS